MNRGGGGGGGGNSQSRANRVCSGNGVWPPDSLATQKKNSPQECLCVWREYVLLFVCLIYKNCHYTNGRIDPEKINESHPPQRS